MLLSSTPRAVQLFRLYELFRPISIFVTLRSLNVHTSFGPSWTRGMSWKIFARVTSPDDVIWIAQTKIALNSYTMMLTLLFFQKMLTLLWIAQTTCSPP